MNIYGFLPFVIALIAVEMLCYASKGKSYPYREAGASFGVFLGRFPSKILLLLFVGPVYAFFWQFRIATIPMNSLWAWLLLFLLFEFLYYWYHRLSHQIRWLWADHSVHHSSNSFTLSGAYRLGWTNIISGVWIFWIPLILIGFNPQAVQSMLLINLAYQFWLHTEIIPELGFIETIFNTPTHHRVHHASNARYLDCNFGGVIMLYDKIFGTFKEESPVEPCRYGLTKPIQTLNPFKIAFGEIRRMLDDVVQAKTRYERIGFLFGSPGWKPSTGRSRFRFNTGKNKKHLFQN